MKNLKQLFVSFVVAFVIAISAIQSADATCTLNIQCESGTPNAPYRDTCQIASNDCTCTVQNARTCRAQVGTCSGANVIWEKWFCDTAVACPCEYGGEGGGEW